MKISVTVILYLFHHCVLVIDNLFARFIGPEIKEGFAPEWTISSILITLDLGDLEDEIWDFWEGDI